MKERVPMYGQVVCSYAIGATRRLRLNDPTTLAGSWWAIIAVLLLLVRNLLSPSCRRYAAAPRPACECSSPFVCID